MRDLPEAAGATLLKLRSPCASNFETRGARLFDARVECYGARPRTGRLRPLLTETPAASSASTITADIRGAWAAGDSAKTPISTSQPRTSRAVRGGRRRRNHGPRAAERVCSRRRGSSPWRSARTTAFCATGVVVLRDARRGGQSAGGAEVVACGGCPDANRRLPALAGRVGVSCPCWARWLRYNFSSVFTASSQKWQFGCAPRAESY